ncbi:fumarylacetoacetate hydrolase family protein [Cupriavidus basilensis]
MQTWIRFQTGDGGDRFWPYSRGSCHRVRRPRLTRGPEPTGAALPREGLRLLSPCDPGKIVALWNATSMRWRASSKNRCRRTRCSLIKPASSVAGPGDAILRPRSYAGQDRLRGRTGHRDRAPLPRNVSPEDAASHYLWLYRWSTQRDRRRDYCRGSRFPRSGAAPRGFDTFGCLGPAIVTNFDWRAACVVTRLDGAERQELPAVGPDLLA